ncbi:hypothetical protein HID58_052297 [Brassica napus]|uniref:Protein RFT1 homolog n=1 Tax=Brassica napus TaxID=3708 RepID=A0ABQ8AC85_BRANA|nr:hypothetical protein HID58_052297 [Brassica napus]
MLYGLGSTFTGCTHSSKLTVITVYAFLYGRMYMALATQSIFQLWFLMVLPMVMEIGLEEGFRSVFFTFQLGTKSHYYGRTILHGLALGCLHRSYSILHGLSDKRQLMIRLIGNDGWMIVVI